MASIEKRTSKVGRTTTWRVKWRTGGTREGGWDGETCDDLKIARHFKALACWWPESRCGRHLGRHRTARRLRNAVRVRPADLPRTRSGKQAG